jgi:hypothetical protein
MVRNSRTIAAYDDVFEPIRRRRQDMVGKQPGDPARAASAILKLVESAEPPNHLVLGSDALRLVREKLDLLAREMAAWECVSRSTDFD